MEDFSFVLTEEGEKVKRERTSDVTKIYCAIDRYGNPMVSTTAANHAAAVTLAKGNPVEEFLLVRIPK